MENQSALEVTGDELERLKNTWWGLETYMREQGARTHEPVVTSIVDQGFVLLREGAKLTDSGSPVQEWGVWMVIAFAQLYNTSMAAWELAYTGYQVQARMLARLMTEYLAVVWYLPNHPDAPARWRARGKLPKASTLLRAVFKLDRETDAQFHGLRKLLNRFSHLDTTGFDMLVGEDESDPRTIPVYIGGRFDQVQFQQTVRVLFPLFGSVPALMAKWKAGAAPEWEDAVGRWVRRVANVLDEYDRRAAEGTALTTQATHG